MRNYELVWQVYLLECSDKSLYCGITKDIVRRLKQHNAGIGSKYTRARLPVKLSKISATMDHSSALKLECKIKKLPKDKKINSL